MPARSSVAGLWPKRPRGAAEHGLCSQGPRSNPWLSHSLAQGPKTRDSAWQCRRVLRNGVGALSGDRRELHQADAGQELTGCWGGGAGGGRTLGITARSHGAHRLCPPPLRGNACLIQASKSPPELLAKPRLGREEEKGSRPAMGQGRGGESGHLWAPPCGQSGQCPVHWWTVV